MNYRFAFSVQHSLSAAASIHQLRGNEISSLALVEDPAEKGACEWEVDLMKSWKAGRKLFKKIHGGDTGMCCVIFEDTGLFPGKSRIEKVWLSTAFVS